MNEIVISNGVASFTGIADETAEPIWNSNVNITIGGIPRAQTDSQRLRIIVKIVCTQTQLRTLMSVIKEFRRELEYTPSRLLYDKSIIEPMRVVIDGSPKPEINGRDGSEILYFIEIVFIEVI